MTYIEVISALLIFSFFIFAFAQAFLPLYNAWDMAAREFSTAHTIYFVAESFRRECIKPDRNMEKWKNAVSTAKELETYEINEIMKGEAVWALKLTCIISGLALEIIGVCRP